MESKDFGPQSYYNGWWNLSWGKNDRRIVGIVRNERASRGLRNWYKRGFIVESLETVTPARTLALAILKCLSICHARQ